MKKKSRIYLAGHGGLVGSAIHRKLNREDYSNIVCRSHSELDLVRQDDVENFFSENKPEYVFLSAGKVGGIGANIKSPADFYYINTMIAANVIHSAYKHNVKKLLYLSSSCIYPKSVKQPMAEGELLNGRLEPTNEGYALAKIGGLKMCGFYREQYGYNFVSAIPTNIYGINDDFSLQDSHLISALIRKFHNAKIFDEKEVVIWGTGTPYREFMYVDDLADALVFIMLNYDEKEHINIGTGIDYTVLEYAQMVKEVTGFNGEISYDLSKPDGTHKKQLNVSKINQLGWSAKIKLKDGLNKTYQWFLSNRTL